MGIGIFDKHTLGHFMGGFVSRLVIFPNNFFLCLIISFPLHLGVELLEWENNPKNGHILETKINKVSDMIFFTIGFIISELLYNKISNLSIYKNVFIYVLLSLIFILETTKEYIKEIFPKKKIFEGVFTN